MLDSAANNHQRFVRASLDGEYSGPFYDQLGWVDAHGYTELSWTILLEWWKTYHDILRSVIDRIPEVRMTAICRVGSDEPVTLQLLIEDYIVHQQHHLRQLQAH